MSEYTGPKTDDRGQATYAYVTWMQAEIERLRKQVERLQHADACRMCGDTGWVEVDSCGLGSEPFREMCQCQRPKGA